MGRAVRQGRAAGAAGVALAALVGTLLAGCSGDQEPSSPSSPSSPADSPTSSTPATPSSTTPPVTSQPVGTGCRAGGGRVPAGANSAPTADLDLDGVPDQLWLVDQDDQRVLGVKTATGATFSTTFAGAAPQTASAIGQRLGGSDPGIVLLDTGRSVELYTTTDCELTPTTDDEGEPWSFDLGFTGYGTGVGCADLGSGLQLVGLLSEDDGEGGFRVTRTAIELDDFGRTARGGDTEVLAEHADADDPVVESAHTVTCGDQDEGVPEPRP